MKLLTKPNFLVLLALHVLTLRGGSAEPHGQVQASVPVDADRSPLVAGQTPADRAWAVVMKSVSSATPRPPADKPAEVLAWGLRYVHGVLVAVNEFYQQHPNDPRRWTGVQRMVDRFDNWTGREELWSDAERQAADAVMPAAERNEWRRKLGVLRAAALAASDIAPGERIYFDSQNYFLICRVARAALQGNQPADLTSVKLELDRLVEAYPDQPAIAGRVSGYVALKQLAGATPDEIKDEWRIFASSPSEHIRMLAKERLRLIDLTSRPIDIAFTATDGRAVDIAALKGRVVLVDFWATWCGPCIADLPNIKRVYAEYHDRGFEIIGIALENAGLRSGDTPEQAAAKLEKAKKVLTDFTTREQMPWPQYFDGKHWKNDFAARYGISSIPAMFLIDQAGQVVALNLKGEKLEAEVRKLLKL